MRLLGWELKKILHRRMTRVLLGICLAVVLLMSVTPGFANLGFGTEVEAPTWEARARSVQATADAASWHGPLDGEALLAARDACRSDPTGDHTFVEGNILSWASRIFAAAGIIPTEDWPARMLALEDDTLTGVYDRRTDLLRTVYGSRPPAEQELLWAQEARVTKPFTYDWVGGHALELDQLINTMLLVGLLLCAAVAPVFCGEVRTRVYTLGHCARYGRGKLAAAKLGAVLLFTGGAFAVLMGLFVAIQLAFFGTRGLSASLQMVSWSCMLPLTVGHAEALLLGSGLLSCLAAAAITAALSAVFSTEFPVLLGLFAVLVFLRQLAIQAGGGCLAQTLPFLATLGELTGNTLITLPGGSVRLQFFYRLAVQPVYLVLLLPLAWRLYTRRQVG